MKDVIIACDFSSAQQTLDFLDKFEGKRKPFVKIGMELFYSAGPDIVRAIKDSILVQYPGSSVIIMGDMNDDPDDPSMAIHLGAKKQKEDCGPTDLFNPWWKTLRDDGIGTLKYDGKWNLFDQIVMTGNLVDGDRSHLQFFRNEIFVRDFMLQHEGKNKGNPLRTSASGVWQNGYSDHLPTTIYLVKEAQ